MTTLTGIMPIELEVEHVDGVPYISKKSLDAAVTGSAKSQFKNNKRTGFIPSICAPNKISNRYPIKYYTITNALIYVEYVLSALGQLQRFIIRLIREEYGEYI